MRTKNTVQICVLLLWIFAASPTGLLAASRPNVLFLLSDDQRADTIAAMGNRTIKTPNLDTLVKTGTTFTRAYCMGGTVGAICAPSRAMIMTGRTLWRAPLGLADVPIMPEVFRQSGYATCGIGKWHNERKSFARGFSTGGPVFFGGMGDHFSLPISDFDPTGKFDPKLTHKADRYSSVLFADAAIDFLHRRKADEPFFIYVAFTAPHDPRTPPENYAKMYDPKKMPLPRNFLPEHPFDNGELKIRDEMLAPHPRTPEEVRRHLADYYGMISHLDEQVGRVLAALKESGAAKDTIIVYTSDHGLAVGSHGLMGKQNLYEHSMRSPLIFAGPGIPHGKKSDALCHLLDIFPTLADLADVKLPAGVDGQSLRPVLTGGQTQAREALLLGYRDVQRAVITDRWKLISYPKLQKLQLFDLRKDPAEMHNLADDPKQSTQVQLLKTKMAALQQSAEDPSR